MSRKRVARIMRENGLYGRKPTRFRVTTNSKHDDPVAPNVLARDFKATGVDRKWVGDITYVWTDEVWLYLAVPTADANTRLRSIVACSVLPGPRRA